MPVLLAHAIEDSTDIFGISRGGGFEHPKPPLGTPLKKIQHPSRLESSYMSRHGVVITILSHKCKSFRLLQNKVISHFWDCNYFALQTTTGKNVMAIAICFLC